MTSATWGLLVVVGTPTTPTRVEAGDNDVYMPWVAECESCGMRVGAIARAALPQSCPVCSEDDDAA